VCVAVRAFQAHTRHSSGTLNTWDTRSAASPPAQPLLEPHRFLRRGPVNAEGWSQLVAKDRDWERSYRGR
jgi:hypothetical protein